MLAKSSVRRAALSAAFFAGTVALCVAGLSSNAWAQGAPNPFGNAGDLLWGLGQKLILLGRGGMLVGGGWSILAAMGKIGYFSAAVSVFAAGMFLANLPKLIDYLMPAV